jgi:beta-barrel assembly-enhancing protease
MSIRLPRFAALITTALVSSAAVLPSATVFAQQNRPENLHPTFVRAKRDLKTEMYTLYRIVDRLARANSLSNTSWRVRVLPEYNVNAFATEANLIGVYSGMMDTFNGDNSALACVLAHEQAHHIRRHIAVGTAQGQAITAQRQKELDDKRREIRDSATGAEIGTSVLGLGGFGGLIRANAQQREAKVAAEKEAQRKAELALISRKQEMEADEAAYIYMARAGFDPQGCIRMFEVLSRTAGAEMDTDHPSVPSRISAMQDLMAKTPATTLSVEGRTNLARTQPLAYGMSTDGQSLRINSAIGSSPSRDIQF